MEKIATCLKAPQKSTPKNISAFIFKLRTLYQHKEIFFQGSSNTKENQSNKTTPNK